MYVGDEGVTEVSGATRRIGIDFDFRAQISSWLWGDADINLSKGRFIDEPDGENYIPLAPTFTSTGGLTARLSNNIDASLRYIFIGSRPANEDNSVRAKGATLFDAAISYSFGLFKIGLSVENILDVNWNEAQFDTESRLRNEPAPISELHFTPGTPRSLKASFTYNFGNFGF